MQLVAGWGLAAVLVASALLKLSAPRSSIAALATFGVPAQLRGAVWLALVALELGLAAGVALGSDAAALLAAATLTVFAGALVVALALGRRDAPCACFGARSRVSPAAVARNVVLAGAFASLPLLPDARPSTEALLVLGLVVALAGVAALAVAVFALAREVGVLRLQVAPQQALELADEGPTVGERSALAERFESSGLSLAVFSSDGCRLCRRLAPAVEALARDPQVEVAVFDETRDADAWSLANVPGSPFAVALDGDGVVRAKGTFNTRAQLEGILAAAERRARAAAGA